MNANNSRHKNIIHWRDPGFRVQTNYADHDLKVFSDHSHTYTELIIIAEGCGIQRVNEIEYDICAGDVFVIQGEQTHGFKALKNIFLWNVAFGDPSELPGYDALRTIPGFVSLFTLEPYTRGLSAFGNRLRLDPGGLVWATALVKRLRQEQEEQRPGWREMSRSLLTELVVFLSRRYDGLPVSLPEDARIQTIGRIMALMEVRKGEKLTLPGLAAHAGMSVNNFLRVFKAMTGRSPVDHLIALRVDAAKTLLRNSRLPVGEIAAVCGFEDSNYFSRRFRRATGASPLQYRRTGKTAP